MEVILKDVCLPNYGKLYTKVINKVQYSIRKHEDSLEELTEEVQTLCYTADHNLPGGNLPDRLAEASIQQ